MQATISNAPHPSAPPTCHGRWMTPEFEPGLVSVIVPTYNRAHLIIETLDSVFAQTYRPIELLIVDDGSTDETAEVVHKWKEHHEQDGFAIHFFTQENRGAPAARNLGLIESRGEFIQFLDSDDLIHPEKLERHVSSLLNGNNDYVWSKSQPFQGTAQWPRNITGNQPRVQSVADHIKRCQNLKTEAVVYRRLICVKTGPWDEHLPVFQDGEYNLRMLLTSTQIHFVPGVLAMFRVEHGPRISDRFKGGHAHLALSRYEELLHEFDALNVNNTDALAAVYFAYALHMLATNEDDRAREFLKCGLCLARTRSRRIRLRALQAVACLPCGIAAPTVWGLISFHKWLQQRRVRRINALNMPSLKNDNDFAAARGTT